MENEVQVKTEHLVKRYPMGAESFPALQDINLQFMKGEFTGIVGPSGSGKTTLLNIIGTLDKPTEGEALLLGKTISKLTHKEGAKIRNEHLGFIFQTYNLLPVYTVFENVEFPLLLLSMEKKERDEAVWQALEWMQITEKAKVKPNQLSGGQAQRVAIARSIVKKPKIVIADEPTANLDAKNSHRILQLMVDLNKDLQTTFIFSTHDEKVIQYLRRIINLEDGRVASDELVELNGIATQE
ncbi:MAG: ATP-binding cassette domain-containing protein [Caldithrix sp.]|nr:ATP-binding cassette domain-containing protein [Caldithrix sp.]